MAEVYPLKDSDECSMHKRVICYRLFWTQRMLCVVLVITFCCVSFDLDYISVFYFIFKLSFGMELGGWWGK